MSKESDEKLPWGLKQSAPGSLKVKQNKKVELKHFQIFYLFRLLIKIKFKCLKKVA
jgi:hypothetical protein